MIIKRHGLQNLYLFQALLLRGIFGLNAGADECWTGVLTFEECCSPPPSGNVACWDDSFTFERCCSEDVSLEANVAPRDAEDETRRAGCEWSFYQSFKVNAAKWLAFQRVSIALIHEFSAIVNQFADVFARCAPAALTALLLKLETVYFEDEAKWMNLLEIYRKYEYRALVEGTLQESHYANGWPLARSLDRVLELRALGQRKLFPSTKQGRAVLHLVISYCGESISWLHGFHKLAWRNENRSAICRSRVALIIYHKCASTYSFQEFERKRLIADWIAHFVRVEIRFVSDVMRMDECSAYPAYILDHYNLLATFVVFLHADAPEHIPNFELLTDTVFAAAQGYLPDELEFVHFSHKYETNPFARSNCSKTSGVSEDLDNACLAQSVDSFEFPRIWKHIFESSIAPELTSGDVSTYCCANFLVRWTRIIKRPLSFYEKLMKYFCSIHPYQHLSPFPAASFRKIDLIERTPCQLAMYMWHAIFGEPLKSPRRPEDPNLPLFMKLQNFDVDSSGQMVAILPYIESKIIKLQLSRPQPVRLWREIERFI